MIQPLLFERLLSKLYRDIASNVGLFCLSRRFDSLPMWAHYAVNATGFAVEFTDLESEFTVMLQAFYANREVTYAQEIEGVTFDPEITRVSFSFQNTWTELRTGGSSSPSPPTAANIFMIKASCIFTTYRLNLYGA